MMDHEFEEAPSMGGDALPVLYVIRRRGSIADCLGACVDDGNTALCLFGSKPDALEYISDSCHHLEPFVEAVGTDTVGGVLALLDYASKDHTYVTLNPPPVWGINVDGSSTLDPDIEIDVTTMPTFVHLLGILAP